MNSDYTNFSMEEIQKILRALINSQSAFRQEMLKKFDEVDKKFESLKKEVHKVEINLTKRIDKLGMNQAYLEDDTPTREEFEKLEKRVNKIERNAAIS